jgi:8-oxo-dGTP pyrophosphatase MutT (NUDIX family)
MVKHHRRLNRAQKLLLAILDDHSCVDAIEEGHVARIREIVLASQVPLDRLTLPGHATGSALVIDPERRLVLLHYHRKLDGWLQFGGHADDEIDPAQVALRETIEESGLRDLTFYPRARDPRPIDIDVHLIPAAGAMPEHLHLDFRYLLSTRRVVPPGGREGESNQFRWLDLDALVKGALQIKTDLYRLFVKVQRLLDNR